MMNTLNSKVFKVLVDLRNSDIKDDVVIHMTNYIYNEKVNFFKLRTQTPVLYVKNKDYEVIGDHYSFPIGKLNPNSGSLIHKSHFAVLTSKKGDLDFSFLKHCNKEVLIKIENKSILFVSSNANSSRF